MRRTDEDRAHWSQVAAEWIAWVRGPRHDAFWAYRGSLASFTGIASPAPPQPRRP